MKKGISSLVLIGIIVMAVIGIAIFSLTRFQPTEKEAPPQVQTEQPQNQTKQPQNQSEQPQNQTKQPQNQSEQPQNQTKQPPDQIQNIPEKSRQQASQYTDTEHMDVFDAHAHINTDIDASQVISEMNAAGVSMLNLYPIDGDDDSSSLEAISRYPGRFTAFVDTPDSPQPATWFKQGRAFVTFAEAQLSTGKFQGIGETNLRYYGGSGYTPPPDIYVSPDDPLWLQLVDLSARYHVPISFHFVPDDPNANAALERMLSSNKDATFIWAHLGFNNMPLNRSALNDFLLRYPNLYFDTAGIQNMQNPPPQPNSNWGRLTSQSDNGRLNAEWRQFFETWNSRILFGSDAGGGPNGLQRWLNYVGNAVEGATPNAIGHWRTLLSNLDYNAAHNILSANARWLFLKEQRPVYNYSVTSDGKCYPVSVSSKSSVSDLAFNPSTGAIAFTVAGSYGTTGNAVITIPTTLVGGNFTASVDGQSAKYQSTSNSNYATISLEYAGGIRSVTLSAQGNNSTSTTSTTSTTAASSELCA